jgi:hypothetical protein
MLRIRVIWVRPDTKTVTVKVGVIDDAGPSRTVSPMEAAPASGIPVAGHRVYDKDRVRSLFEELTAGAPDGSDVDVTLLKADADRLLRVLGLAAEPRDPVDFKLDTDG